MGFVSKSVTNYSLKWDQLSLFWFSDLQLGKYVFGMDVILPHTMRFDWSLELQLLFREFNKSIALTVTRRTLAIMDSFR